MAQAVCCGMPCPGEVEHGVRILSEGPVRCCDVVFIYLPVPGGDIHDHEVALVLAFDFGADLAFVDLLPALDNLFCGVSVVSHRFILASQATFG